MNKRISLILVLMLIVQTIASSLVLPMQAIAEGAKQSVITGITVTDAEGNEFHKDMPAGTTVNIQVDWSVVDVEVGEGSTESFSIPTDLYVEQEQTGILTDGEIEVGTYRASVNGIVALTFHKEVEERVDANGSFVLEAFVVDHTVQEEKVDSESISEESVEETAIAEEESKSETIGENDDESTEKNYHLDQADSNSTILEEGLEQVTEEEKQGFNLELGQVTDLDGNPYTEESLLNPTDQFKLDLRWLLVNGHTYMAGDKKTFNLPKGIKIVEEITGELKDGSLVVATYNISTDKKVELTFTDFVETHSNVQGWLQIIATLDEENVDVEDGEAIIDPIGEEGEIRIPIEQGNKEKTIEKKGTPNKGYNADEINWDVIINKNKTSLTNSKVIDVLPTGTEYKEDSLKVIKLKVDLYGNILGDLEEVVVTGETVVDGELTIPLGDIKDAYRIEYVTTVTDDEKREFTNNAMFSDDLMEAVTANSTVAIDRGEAVKKKAAKSYNPKTGMIEWEIEFNYNLKDLSDVTLVDAWTPKGKLELVEDSLKFTEVTIDENGNAHETENVSLPEGAVLIPGTDQFEITGITTNKAYKITYQTKVKERVLEPFEVVNTAGFGTESVGSGTGVGTYYGSKTAGTVDYKNKTIDWKIEINHDEYPMENILITDTLGDGLTIKEDTLNITVDGIKYTDYTIAGDNPFTIKFPDNFTTDKKIIITYKTSYVADEVPNHKPTNKAAITWTPEGGNESITKEVAAGTELNNNTKNSHWKNGSYDPTSKEITWTIYTNYRENQIDSLIVKDAPQGNQKIVPDSVVVTELAIEEDGRITEVGQLDSNVATIDESANTLQVTIGETNKAYKIVYKTSLAGLSDIQKEYVNKAEVLDGSEKLSDLNAKVGIAKSDTYGEKSGYQDGKQVHWSVKVNLGQQKISNLTLVDAISPNQEYLTDTIKVYEATVDGDGNATKGEELPVEQYDVTYTPGNPSFTVKWKNEVERAFIVEYSTLFFEKHNGEVTNTYKVTGDNIIEGGTTDGDGTVTIKQLSSGGGSGEVGYLVIDKVDITYGQEEAKLAGAEFDLIDADTGKVLKTGMTDVNGQIDFGRLLFGEYELHERVVPDGYVTKDERQTIVINKKYEAGNDETKLEYRVENYEPVFAIELTKTDAEDSGVLLEGAEFALYDSEDATNPIKTGKTDENGKILFKDLPGAGTYYVQETKAAEYYQLNAEKIPARVGEKEQVPVNITVENQLIPGKGTLKKVDADNPDSVLEGAIFEVFGEEGTIVDTITTDINGVATTKELRPGTYTLIEKTPPKGFKKSTTVHELVIPKANEILEYDIGEGIITNEVKTAKIELTKIDSINGSQLLKGAVFELEYKGGKYSHLLSSGTTDENGKVTFENLKPGTYEIKEINAPEGYILKTEPITVEVTLDDVHFDRTVTRNIENAPLANIIVQKVDIETDAKLNGAEFKVTDETGNDILTGLKTDTNGQISITGLPEGQYYLEEIKAPMGYMLDSTSQRFEVVKDGVEETNEINLTFKNEIIKGSVELVKVDGDNNNVPLEGVEFALKATSLINGGSYIETTHTTDSNGKIIVDNLRPGSYEFNEIGHLKGTNRIGKTLRLRLIYKMRNTK
ncbi:SpaA isopeptide-forming pilin-related protein [Paucisalibacillus sp. EB02]|uniref:SpaA isopeptide-forming pilin-related protein n=1 Tax=Paucisalibacillus sp. EB02 TaxID=1347087 RepID=UPI0004B0B453|nr:SpaA isopeptide-forming pilin-related protein [Paucisalibacillus sp. EB02]